MKRRALLGLAVLLMSVNAFSQYFGQNKPRYTNFDFQVLETEHFEIYHYMNNPATLERMAKWTEQWYDLHENVLKDTFYHKNPIIYYNNHADFQQTNAISGNIGVSTGGVTEGFKNRVVMPIAMSNQQTWHVLGHEMVHAFQFYSLLGGDSTGLESLRNLPLWIVEGMAEYMSIGRVDPHTAMWMRNSVANDDVPTLRDLSTNPKYFAYRYGQAFWSFLTGLYGDKVIKPLFRATAKFGIQRAVPLVLGISIEELSDMWVAAIKEYYEPYVATNGKDTEGRLLFSEENFGTLNIAPSMSPNGRYVIFLSEKDLFSTDLYIYDSRTKKTEKIVSKTRLGNTDFLNYIESSGTWSPDGRQFAFAIFKKGKNRLVIMDAESKKKLDEFTIKGVPAFFNPSWAPDGKTIVVNGLVEGQPDLFSVNVRTKRVEQLTDDPFAEIQPVWSYDGTKIAFATDRLGQKRGRVHGAWKYNLAIYNVQNRTIDNLDIFPGANNMNPQWDENENLYFLSDRNGFRNIYQFNLATEDLYQLSEVVTGISGITPYSPALSVSKKGTSLVYTHYDDFNYNMYQARVENMPFLEVDPFEVDFTAAILPPGSIEKDDIVNPALGDADNMYVHTMQDFRKKNYTPKFKLDYINSSGVGIGVGTSQAFGTRTGLVGGVSAIFSDILGNNKLFGTLALNGEIYDFGGSVAFLNTKQRVGYGLSISHIPFRFGFLGDITEETINTNVGPIPVFNDPIIIQRIFVDEISAISQLPFSQNMRLEGSIGFSRYSSRADQFNRYYEKIDLGNGFSGFGFFLGEDREKLEKPFDGFNTYNAQLALVGDAAAGLISPYSGYRYRIQGTRHIGEFNYFTALVDVRKYWWFQPMSLAVRGFHYARYGQDGDNFNFFGPLYVIDPTLVRGYNNTSLNQLESLYGLELNQLRGSRMLVGNVELRVPFTGPERLSLLKSGFLLSDLNLFFDAGMAWFGDDAFYQSVNEELEIITLDKEVLMSVGASLRVFLGGFVIEPYYARPLREGASWNFGVNFIPGW